MTEKINNAGKYSFSLRFGSYNIANGREVCHDLTMLGADINSQALDIVGLQEVDMFVPRSRSQDSIKILSESSGLPYYAFFKAIDLGGGEYGLGILSKYPILSTDSMRLYSAETEQRILARAAIDICGIKTDFFVTHLSYESPSLRSTQSAAVIEELKKSRHFVLTGDFNMQSFDRFLSEEGFGAVNNSSYRVNTFSDCTIDNIIYDTSSWIFDRPKALANRHSDHNMLYATAYFK